MDRVLDLPLGQIAPDPGQPRKIFDEAALRELASSIRENGLLQPIIVRTTSTHGYWIVAGERRYRAHQIAGLKTIRAIVDEPEDESALRIKQIIENDQRADMTPLEQARAYQSLLTASGWTPAELARRLGKSINRVTERTQLLGLREEYQHLLAGGNLGASQAFEMSRLSPRGQDVLFKAIKEGRCKTWIDLRAQANALVEAEGQTTLIDEPDPPTEAEKRAVRSFETMVKQIAAMLNDSVRDNQVTVLRKVNRDRANTLADLFGAMQKDMRRIELSLREAAIQADLLGAA